MNPQGNKAKDFFLNLGATISLYTVVISLINLLFTVINTAYPQINSYYYSPSISWPVATLIIFTPILIVLMWLLGKQYANEPASAIHRWLTYITLFLAGLAVAGDLVTVIYFFINGDELTTGFLLKALVLFIISGAIFGYYLTDVRGKLTLSSRRIWRIVSILLVIISIIIGFMVIGSPRTQRLYKYDEQKVTDLENINYQIQSFYQSKGYVPSTLDEVSTTGYTTLPLDPQSGASYEYHLVGQSAKAYQLCAEFNKASPEASKANVYLRPVGDVSWVHPAGHYCFSIAIPLNMYVAPGKIPA